MQDYSLLIENKGLLPYKGNDFAICSKKNALYNKTNFLEITYSPFMPN